MVNDFSSSPKVKKAIEQSIKCRKPIKLSKAILKQAATLPRGKVRNEFLGQFTFIHPKIFFKNFSLEITLYPRGSK